MIKALSHVSDFIRVACILLALATIAAAQVDYSQFLEDDFILFWPDPVRAHPAVPLDFRFVVYEKDNQVLTWELQNAPIDMTIDRKGKVDWTPGPEDVGTQSITVKVTRASGEVRQRTFLMTVGTNDFLFVSTNGNDGNTGAIDQPMGTIEHAMRAIQNGNGKTIYVGGGTYHEYYNWERDGVISPTRGKNFSAQDPLVVRSFPGEAAILDCDLQGHGLWAYSTSYVVFNNIEIQEANAGERGGIITHGDHIVVRDVTVHDSHWSRSSNCTGYLIHGTNTVLDHVVGYNNRDLDSDHWNSSNYLIYTEGSGDGYIHVLNSVSFGSIVGFKIKHAGPRKLVVHNCLSYNDKSGYGFASDFSSVRYSVSLGSGIHVGMTDPNSYTTGKVLLEHNTVTNAPSYGINFQGSYQNGNSIIRNNILFNNLEPAGTGESDDRLMAFWIYSADAHSYTLDSDRNLLYGLSQNNIVRYGSSNWNYSLTRWQTEKGQDGNSVWGDPRFLNLPGRDVGIPAGSPGDFGGGDFAGAFAPGISGIERFHPSTPLASLLAMEIRSIGHRGKQISFQLPRRDFVTLAVYTMSGRRMVALLNGMRSAGPTECIWNGLDKNGRPVAHSTYYCRLSGDGYSIVSPLAH